MRYIIDCEDPVDIVLGMKAIKVLIRDNKNLAVVFFEDNSSWLVRKNKSGYSAKKHD